MPLLLVAILSLVLPACATLRGSYPVEVSGRAAVEIDVGRSRESVSAAYLRYFPESITLRPGDAVRFQLQGTGEPHTVTLGKLVQAREVNRLPTPFESTAKTTRVNTAAVRPCYLERLGPDDAVTNATDCARDKQPAFDGRQIYFSSGLLDGSNDVFRMELANEIRPGRYAFVCLVHPDVMRGTLNVVSTDAHRSRPKAVMERADEEEKKTAEDLAGSARSALEATPDRAIAGLPGPSGTAAYLATFGQRPYRINRGESVRWTVFGTHTITFGTPPDGAGEGFAVETGDGAEANRALLDPVGSPALPTDSQLRAAAKRRDVIDVDARWDGADRLHSGLLSSRRAGALRYSVTFSKRGNYKYQCLVHPKMRGSVVVT